MVHNQERKMSVISQDSNPLGRRSYLGPLKDYERENPSFIWRDINYHLREFIVDYYTQLMKERGFVHEKECPTSEQLLEYMIETGFPTELVDVITLNAEAVRKYARGCSCRIPRDIIELISKSDKKEVNLAEILGSLPIPKRGLRNLIAILPRKLREMYFNNPYRRYTK